MKIKLKKISEDKHRIVYKIDQDFVIINNKTFKIDKNVCNLSTYLQSNGDNLINFLNQSIDNYCINCSNEVKKNRFERNKFFVYKFCDKCYNDKKILTKYNKVKCGICHKEIYKKDVILGTCGDEQCLIKHKEYIKKIITDTHWSKSDNREEIRKNITIKRKENDKLYNRKYIPWNKGKTNIYSKETIEKIRNSTIKQMREGKIHKSKIEILFEDFLKENEIKYVYSFIFKNRQYDFLLVDYNIVVEINGDYWHANPLFWDVNNNDFTKKPLYETQKMKIKDDIIKENLIKESKYELLSFWENDLYKNFSNVIQTLESKKIKLKK